jgi:hypothetical protein
MDKKIGMKFDGQGCDGNEVKVRWELMPWEQLEEVAKVLTAGGIKYEDNNWKIVEPRSRYVGALFRHFIKWFVNKEKFDKDIFKLSGYKVSHLACLACNALFLMWFDDNPEPE